VPDRILERLNHLHPKAIDLSLGRVRRLLAALGHPERALPPVVHIAGTNGKGSTLAMLDAMLQAEGLTTHRYISPHLVRFHERILLKGAPIDDAALEAVLLEAEEANGDAPITFFEITTAAAMLAFSRTPADVLLLETGLGGRLDATNVVPHPLMTLIAPISFDHEAYLGRSLSAIAREKCGILRPAVPAVVGPQHPAAATTIRQACARLGAPLTLAGEDFRVHLEGDGFRFADPDGTLSLPAPILPGAHQCQNAGLAVAAARRLGPLAPSPDAIAAGLRSTRWPARLQRLDRGKLLNAIRREDELWIDGGHNPEAGQAVAAFFGALERRPLRVVLGMLTTKDAGGYLAPLAPQVDRLVAVDIAGSDSAQPPARLAATARRLGVDADTADDLQDGLASLASGAPARIAVLGSLYLAGRALAENG
jgi:dihydrofolate synthase/folylpolyglutamate synthase